MMPRVENILILGAYGRLGEALSLILDTSHNVLRHGRNKDAQVYLPELTVHSLMQTLVEYKITAVINLIAFTDVNKCENETMNAFYANATIPHYIRTAVDEINRDIFVLQVSTDQIYSGIGMLDETCINPINVYSVSKFAGEQLINACANTCILRTNYFGLSLVNNRSSFLDWIVDSIQENKEISVYQDVFYTPVGSKTLCSTILMLIDDRVSGTFNFGSNKSISKADFAWIVADAMNIQDPRFVMSEYPKNALVNRPKNMSMNSKKLLNTLALDPIKIEREVKHELQTLIH